MIKRPCLACGAENESAAGDCGRCHAPLSAWSQRLPAMTPSRSVRRMPSRRGLLLLGLVAALAVAFGPRGWDYLMQSTRTPEGPTWRDPASIAAWAGDELHAAGVEPSAVDARVEKRTAAPRRLVITGHPTGQGLLDIVRATAKLLVLAREKGEATATNLAIIRHGTRVLLLPTADASRVARTDEAAAAWLDEQERLRDAAPAGDDDPSILMGPPWSPPPDASALMGPPASPTDDLAAGTPIEEPVAVVSAVPPPATAGTVPPPGPAPTPVVAPPAAPATATAKMPSEQQAPPIRVLKTNAGGALKSRAQPAQEGVLLLRFQVHPGTRRALRLESLSLRARGTLPDVEDISFIDLYRDVDRDGKKSPADTRLGPRQSFSDDDGKLDFENLGLAFGEDGAGIEMLVTADLNDESLGGTILLAMQDPTFVNVTELSSKQRCGVRGVPLTGPVISVDANVEEDPEQARLDALAEAGPDAVDERLGDMRGQSAHPDEAVVVPASGESGPDGQNSQNGQAGQTGQTGATGPTGPAPGPIAPVSPFQRRR